MPFAPEVGVAAPFGEAFAVGALEPTRGGVNALILLVGSARARIELGAVHGDVVPPLVALQGQTMIAAVQDGAPSGTLVRLARIEAPGASARVVWGAEVPQGRDESDTFALELGAAGGSLAWDEWDGRDAGHGVVKLVTFAGTDVSKVSASQVLSSADEDAEAPALASRPGGFWAAWITNGHRAPDKKERESASNTGEPVDLGPRWVTLVPLDAQGEPAGAPIAVTPRNGRATGFELAPAESGAALVAWREDRSSPAAPGGTAQLALVRADGSVEPHPLADAEVGAGLPIVLVDDHPAPGSPYAWLALESEADLPEIVALDATGHALDVLAAEPGLGMAMPLAVHGGRVLALRPRGHGIELSTFECRTGRPGP